MTERVLTDMLKTPTVFIVGDGEVLNFAALHFLFKPVVKIKVHKYYFINPGEYLINFLNRQVESKDYAILTDLPDFNDVSGYNLIVLGVKSTSNQLLKITQKSKRNILLFFSNKIGIFSSNFSKSTISICEYSFNRFASENTSLKKEQSDFLEEKEKDFFTNRTTEVKDLNGFIDNIKQRGCKISGMDSIGKNSFVKEAKLRFELQDNCYEHAFSPNANSHIDLIVSLYSLLGIKSDFKQLKRSHKNKFTALHNQFFIEFDKIPNAKIIFYQVQYLLKEKDGRFLNRDIFLFFQELLNRSTYKGNKVYFISNQNFRFSIETELLCTNIELKGMNFDFIKRILQNEFDQMGKNEFAEEIIRNDEHDKPVYDHKTIDELTNGNPQIAKMFAKQISTEGIAGIHTYINDADYRKKFDNEKVEFLLKKLTLTDEEKRMLNLLCLVTANFNKEFFKKISSNPVEDLLSLKDRFLIEVDYYKKGESYYITRIVQSCILPGIKQNKPEYKGNNNLIAGIYWELANNEHTSSYKQIQYYNMAEYHFTEAGNFEKVNLLMLERTEIYLLKAEELYDNNQRREAWRYFDELYKKNIEFSSHQILHYIVCNTQLKKEGTNELYREAITRFEKDTYIYNSYSNYLILNNNFKEAENICLKMIDDKIANKATTNILARTIHKLGNPKKAISIIKSQIENYPRDLTDSDKELLINDLMTYYKILDCNNKLKQTFKNTTELIVEDRLHVSSIGNIRTSSLPEHLVKDVRDTFEIAIKHKNADKIAFNRYIDFLERQGDKSKAISVKRIKEKVVANTYKMFSYEEILPNEEISNLIDSQFTDKEDNDSDDEIDTGFVDIQSPGKVYKNLTEVPTHQEEIKIDKPQPALPAEVEKNITLASEENIQQFPKQSGIPEIKKVDAANPKTDIQKKQPQLFFKHKSEVFNILQSCEQMFDFALSLLNRIFSLEEDNFRALNAKYNLLIEKSELLILKEKIKQDYALKQKINSMITIPKIFISYSHEDKKIADHISALLRDQYIDVTIDSSMIGSKDIQEFIEQTIANTEVTISIVSKSSLLSTWVGMETINTFYRNKFSANKKLIACYIDDSFFNRNFVFEAAQKLDKEINDINELIQKQTNLNIDTRNLNNEKTRYLNLKNNIDEFVRYFKESISIDIRGKKLEINFQKILDSILSSTSDKTNK